MTEFEVGDRVIVVNAPMLDRALSNGDYGRISIVYPDGDICVYFKRLCKTDMDEDDEGQKNWVVDSSEIMKCKKGLTWDQVRMLADIVRSV